MSTFVTVTFSRDSRLLDIDAAPLHKYILPANDTEPYYVWWTETEFSYWPNRVVEGLRLVEEVEEDGTVSHSEVSSV